FSWPSLPATAIGNVLAFRQSLEGLFDGQQDRGLDRGQGPSSGDGEDRSGYGDIVRRLEDHVAVVLAEPVPEAVQRAADLLDVRARRIAPVFRVLDELRPRL